MMHSVYWASPWAGEQRKGLDPKPDVYSFLPQDKGAGLWAYRGWAVSRGFLGKLYLFSLQETGEVSNKPRLGIFSIFPSICPVLKSEILPCFLVLFCFFFLSFCALINFKKEEHIHMGRIGILKLTYTHCALCLVAQLCLTLCNPMDFRPPDFSVHRILQARTLERVAISFSSGWKWNRSVVSDS